MDSATLDPKTKTLEDTYPHHVMRGDPYLPLFWQNPDSQWVNLADRNGDYRLLLPNNTQQPYFSIVGLYGSSIATLSLLVRKKIDRTDNKMIELAMLGNYEQNMDRCNEYEYRLLPKDKSALFTLMVMEKYITSPRYRYTIDALVERDLYVDLYDKVRGKAYAQYFTRDYPRAINRLIDAIKGERLPIGLVMDDLHRYLDHYQDGGLAAMEDLKYRFMVLMMMRKHVTPSTDGRY